MSYEGSRVEVAIVKEITPGSTPNTPAWQKVNYTDQSLDPGYETEISNRVRSNQASSDLIRTGQTPTGGWNTEWTFGDDTDLLLESGLGGEFSGNILKAGDDIVSISCEKKIPEAGQDYYFRWKGGRVNTINMSIDANNGLISGSTDFLWLSTDVAKTPVTGATYAEPPENPVFAFKNFDVSAFTELTNKVCLSTLDVTINKNLRTQKGRCTDDITPDISNKGIAAGRRTIDISVSLYYSAGADELYQLMVEDKPVRLVYDVDDGTNGYRFIFPKVKLSNAPIPTSNDTDVIANFTGQALFAALPAVYDAGGTVYNTDDEVTASNNNVYRCNTDGATGAGDDPAVDDTKWDLIGVDTDYNTDVKVEKFTV